MKWIHKCIDIVTRHQTLLKVLRLQLLRVIKAMNIITFSCYILYRMLIYVKNMFTKIVSRQIIIIFCLLKLQSWKQLKSLLAYTEKAALDKRRNIGTILKYDGHCYEWLCHHQIMLKGNWTVNWKGILETPLELRSKVSVTNHM